ncbi:putative E3 ubiquitin protein ligase [Blyttiomyces helicus]|uniref:Putative E3 ubiquitin protein ligase n=1 Tax=Blyttiomyces helicus TaxID=388810 RepID=A0A4P9W6G4_9FUNG|nr:putative E3 ubiquitin protein ligase [Blyttiomyces helicus]|eukprot:RKO88049.1 putative E3 ubiquitin protein ligase [Blyttiomyces helicus]
MRRIALGDHSSLQIEINAVNPAAVPECRFMGSEKVVGALREAMMMNLNSWSSTATLRENLERVLGRPFPPPPAESHQDESPSYDCGICMGFHLDGASPDYVCANPKCGQAFHPKCLQDWLLSVPTTRQNFSFLLGSCPYCKELVNLAVV